MGQALKIDRATAHKINPFISQMYAEDTMGQCASAVRTLGLMISVDPGGIDLSPFCALTDTIACALEWEQDSVISTKFPASAGEAGD